MRALAWLLAAAAAAAAALAHAAEAAPDDGGAVRRPGGDEDTQPALLPGEEHLEFGLAGSLNLTWELLSVSPTQLHPSVLEAILSSIEHSSRVVRRLEALRGREGALRVLRQALPARVVTAATAAFEALRAADASAFLGACADSAGTGASTAGRALHAVRQALQNPAMSGDPPTSRLLREAQGRPVSAPTPRAVDRQRSSDASNRTHSSVAVAARVLQAGGRGLERCTHIWARLRPLVIFGFCDLGPFVGISREEDKCTSSCSCTNCQKGQYRDWRGCVSCADINCGLNRRWNMGIVDIQAPR